MNETRKQLHFGQFHIGIIILGIVIITTFVIMNEKYDCTKVQIGIMATCQLAKNNITFFFVFVESVLMTPIIIQGLNDLKTNQRYV